jgi:hypothetical protein
VLKGVNVVDILSDNYDSRGKYSIQLLK